MSTPTARVTALATVGLGVAITLPWWGDRYGVDVAIITLLYAYLGVAWNMAGGFAGLLSLGHSVFFGVGAYTSSLLLIDAGISPILGAVAGAALAAVLGASIAWIGFRYSLPHISFALITLALAILSLQLAGSLTFLGGHAGLLLPPDGGIGDLYLPREGYYLLLLALTVGVTVFAAWLRRRPFGLGIRSAKHGVEAAEAIGVDVLRLRMGVLAISAALTAVGGTAYAQYLLYVEPNAFFGVTILIQVILFTVIGGLGTVSGPIVGAVLLVPLGEWMRGRLGGELPGLNLIIYGALIVIMVRFLPSGVVGAIAQLRARRARHNRETTAETTPHESGSSAHPVRSSREA